MCILFGMGSEVAKPVAYVNKLSNSNNKVLMRLGLQTKRDCCLEVQIESAINHL